MSEYTRIQLISWELYTGPVIGRSKPRTRGWYSGLLAAPELPTSVPDVRVDVIGQCVDIDARLAFTADAITKARALADPAPTTLKVFLAPEFIYRGAGGAYVHDLLNGWKETAPSYLGISPAVPYYKSWAGLFGGLRSLAAQAEHEHWLFVFGTAVSATFPTNKPSKGKFFLAPSQARDIRNTSLVQCGGLEHASTGHTARKQYDSSIDFLHEYAGFISHIVAPISAPKSSKERTPLPTDFVGTNDTRTAFHLPGINDSDGKPIDFGLEICLDHASNGVIDSDSTLPTRRFGRVRAEGRRVKIQLVPSCGMNLVSESIWLQAETGSPTHSYAFHCDGLSDIARQNYGNHTQVWNRKYKLLEAGNGQEHGKFNPKPALVSAVSAVTNSVNIAHHKINDAALWSDGDAVGGAGAVRVVASLPL
jgi:hypothetical protein